MRSMRSRRAATALLIAAACGLSLLFPGCAEIGLRRAMTGVEERYRSLLEKLEAGSNLAARDAARELGRALESPAIAELPPQARAPEFQRLLREAVESTRRVQAVARSFNARALGGLRSEISARCDACHEKFRPRE